MKLDVRRTFACTPDAFWAMYWDPAFEDRLRKGGAVGREVVEERDEDGVLFRRIRITPEKELPGPAAAIVGTKKLVYDQETRWDRSKGVLRWQVVPTFLPGKLDAKGQVRVEATPRGCAMVVDGDIVVNVRFIGGQIEKAVVAEVEKSYQRLAEHAEAWLAENR